MSQDQNGPAPRQAEFVPLNAPRIGKDQPGRAAPVNWYQRVAPRLDSGVVAPTLPAVTKDARTGKPVTPAAFPSVNAIAAEARERLLLGTPDPPEILQLRYQAEQAARELVGEAYLQAQAIEDEARSRGHQEGYAAGYAAGEREAVRTLTQRADAERAAYQEDIAAFLQLVEAERKRIWDELEPQMIDLVFDLARQVIKQEVEVCRTAALAAVRNAIRRVAGSGTLRIRVNAEDLDVMRGSREELLTLVDNIHHLEIVADRRVGPGGCVVDTDAGSIDARIDTQLDEVASALKKLGQPG